MPLRTTYPTTKEPMTWLFKAKFADGHIIEQDLEDTCHSRDDGTGSAFSDVLAYGKPSGFGLYHEGDKQYIWVDLITGNFVVNGTVMAAHNQNFEPEKYPLELVYFRETRVEQTVNRDAEIVSTRHYINKYFIGWKTLVNGKDKPVLLAVA